MLLLFTPAFPAHNRCLLNILKGMKITNYLFKHKLGHVSPQSPKKQTSRQDQTWQDFSSEKIYEKVARDLEEAKTVVTL